MAINLHLEINLHSSIFQTPKYFKLYSCTTSSYFHSILRRVTFKLYSCTFPSKTFNSIYVSYRGGKFWGIKTLLLLHKSILKWCNFGPMVPEEGLTPTFLTSLWSYRLVLMQQMHPPLQSRANKFQCDLECN